VLARALLLVAIVGCGKSTSEPSKEGSGSGGVAKPQEPTAKVDPKEKVRRYQECWAAFNANNGEAFGNCFALDATREQADSVPELVAVGRENIAGMMKTQKTSIPDMKVTPQRVIVSGNDIAAIVHVSGEMKGKKLGVYEAQLAVLGDDNTFSKESFVVDQPTVFHQLGMIENDASPSAIPVPGGEPEILISKNDDVERANKELVQKNLDAMTKKTAKAIEPTVADDVVLVYHGDKNKFEGKAAYMKWLNETIKATSEGKVDVKGIWAAGEHVAVYDVFTGVPSKELGAREGVRIHTQVVQFYRIVDGKIKEHQIFGNRMKIAVQLGLVDPDELAKALKDSE
jgi:predicted ester cyclase